jgi:hypothetical protein
VKVISEEEQRTDFEISVRIAIRLWDNGAKLPPYDVDVPGPPMGRYSAIAMQLFGRVPKIHPSLVTEKITAYEEIHAASFNPFHFVENEPPQI